MHHCGHSSEGSCRVLTDICVPSGAIICQAHASLMVIVPGRVVVEYLLIFVCLLVQ